MKLEKIKYIVIGLWNPGMLNSRHSVGYKILSIFANENNLPWFKIKKVHALFSIYNENILLVKPLLAINLSGKIITEIMKNVKFNDIPKIIIIHDDLESKCGKTKILFNNSAKGHNGIKSIFTSLETKEITRISIGIGRPTDKDYVSQYVLDDFNKAEQKILYNRENTDCTYNNVITNLMHIVS